MHRVGGIEKDALTGNISYDPANHQKMTDLRRDKVLGIDVPDQDVAWGDDEGELVVVGWGSTYGPIKQAVNRWIEKGAKVSHVHVRHIWPLPGNLGDSESLQMDAVEHFLERKVEVLRSDLKAQIAAAKARPSRTAA